MFLCYRGQESASSKVRRRLDVQFSIRPARHLQLGLGSDRLMWVPVGPWWAPFSVEWKIYHAGQETNRIASPSLVAMG